MAGPTPLLIHVRVCVHVCVCTCVNFCVFIQLLSSTFSKLLPPQTVFWWDKKTTSSSNDAKLVFPVVKKAFKRSAEILLLYYSKAVFPMKMQFFCQMQWCLTVASTVSFAPVTHNAPILPHMDSCKDHNHVLLTSMDRCHFFTELML